MDKKPGEEIEVTNADRNASAIKAGVKLLTGGVVGVVDAMIQLNQGKFEEARTRRLDEVVGWILEKKTEEEKARAFESEDFANFFNKVKDPISNATNQDKRNRLRDLLFNSMRIPPGDPAWEESMFCLDLLQRVEPAGLYLLAIIERARQDNKWVVPNWDSQNKISLIWKFDGQLNQENITEKVKIYDFALLEKAERELKNMYSLIRETTIRVSKADLAYEQKCLELTSAGILLIKWTTADF